MTSTTGVLMCSNIESDTSLDIESIDDVKFDTPDLLINGLQFDEYILNTMNPNQSSHHIRSIRSDTYYNDFFTTIATNQDDHTIIDNLGTKYSDVTQAPSISTDDMSVTNNYPYIYVSAATNINIIAGHVNNIFYGNTSFKTYISSILNDGSTVSFERYNIPVLTSINDFISSLIFRPTSASSIKLKCKVHGTYMGSSYEFPDMSSIIGTGETVKITVTVVNSKYVLKLSSVELTNQFQFHLNNTYIFDQTDDTNIGHPLDIIDNNNTYITYQRRIGVPGEALSAINASELGTYKCKSLMTKTLSTTALFDSITSKQSSLVFKSKSAINISSNNIFLNSVNIQDIIKSSLIEELNDFTITVNTTPAASSLNYEITLFLSKITNTFMYTYNVTLKLYEKNINSENTIPYTLNLTNDKQINNINNSQYTGYIGSFTNLTPSNQYEIRCMIQNTHTLKFIDGEKILLSNIVLIVLLFELVTNNVYSNNGNKTFNIFFGNVVFNEYFDIEISYSYFDENMSENTVLQLSTHHSRLTDINSSISTDEINLPSGYSEYFSSISILIDLTVTDGSGQIVNIPQFSIPITLPSIQLEYDLIVNPDNREEFFVNFTPNIQNINVGSYTVTITSKSSSIKDTDTPYVFTYDVNDTTTPYIALQVKDIYLSANNYFDISFTVMIIDPWGYASNPDDYNNVIQFYGSVDNIMVTSGSILMYNNGEFTINIYNFDEIKSVYLSYTKHGETTKTMINIHTESSGLQFPEDFIGGSIDITVNATNTYGFINTHTESNIRNIESNMNFFDRMDIHVQNQTLEKTDRTLSFNVSASGTATNYMYLDGSSSYFSIRLSLYSNERQYITEFNLQIEDEDDNPYYYGGGGTTSITNKIFSIELSESTFIDLQQYKSILLSFDITDYYGFSMFVEKQLIIPIVFDITNISAVTNLGYDRAFIVTGEIVTNVINVKMYELNNDTNLVQSVIDQDGMFIIVDYFQGGPVKIIATEQYGNRSEIEYTFPVFYVNISNFWMRPNNNGLYSITCRIDYQMLSPSIDMFFIYLKKDNNTLHDIDAIYFTNSQNSFTIQYHDFVTSIPDNVSLLNNEYIIEVYCRDNNGFEKSSQVTFTIDYMPPVSSSTIMFGDITRVFNSKTTTITWTPLSHDINTINPYNSSFETTLLFQYRYSLEYKNSSGTWISIVEALSTSDTENASISNAPMLTKYPDFEFRITLNRTPYSNLVSNTLSYLGLGSNINNEDIPNNSFTIIWYQNIGDSLIQIYTLTNQNNIFSEYDGYSEIQLTVPFILEEVSGGNIYRLKQSNTYLNKDLSYQSNTSNTDLYMTLTLNTTNGYSLRFVESGEYLYMNSATLTLGKQQSEPTSGSFGFYNNTSSRYSPNGIHASPGSVSIPEDGNYDLSTNSYSIEFSPPYTGVYDVSSTNLKDFVSSENTLTINLNEYSTTNTVVTIKLISATGIIVHIPKTIESATIDISKLTYVTSRIFQLDGTYSDLHKITISEINNVDTITDNYILSYNIPTVNIKNISKPTNANYHIEFSNNFIGGNRRLTAYLNDAINDTLDFNINTSFNISINITYSDNSITRYKINNMENWDIENVIPSNVISNVDLDYNTFDILNTYDGNITISAVSYGFKRTQDFAIANNVLTITGLTQLNENSFLGESEYDVNGNLIVNDSDYDVTNRFYIEGDYNLNDISSVTTINPNIGNLNLDTTSSTNKAIITLPSTSSYSGGNFDLQIDTLSKSATKTITMFPLRNPSYKTAYISKMDTTSDGDFFKNIFHIDTDTLVEPIRFIHKIYNANGSDTGFEFVHVNDYDNVRGEYNINSMYIDSSTDIYVFKTKLIDKYLFTIEIQYTHYMNSSVSLYEFEENAFNINLPGTITNVQATTSSGTISAQLVDASSDQTSSFPFEFNQHVNEIDVDYDIEITVIYNDDSIVKSSTFLIDPRSILTTSGINPSSSSSSQPTSGVQLDIVGIYAKNAINNISIVNENDVPLESYITELNNYDGIYAKITLDKFTPDGTYTITSSTSTGTTSSTSYTVNFGDTSSISLPTETIQVSANNTVSYIIQNIPDTMNYVSVNHGTYNSTTKTLTIPETFNGNIDITIQNEDGFTRIINFRIVSYNIVIDNLTQLDQSSILGYNLQGSNFTNVDNIIITRNIDSFSNEFTFSNNAISGSVIFVQSVTRISDISINIVFNTLLESTYIFKLSNSVTDNSVSQSLPFTIPTFSKPVMTLREVRTDTTIYNVNLPSSSLSFTNIHALNFNPVIPGLSPVPPSLCAGGGSLNGTGGDEGYVFTKQANVTHPITNLFDGVKVWQEYIDLTGVFKGCVLDNYAQVWFEFPKRIRIIKYKITFVNSNQPINWTLIGYGSESDDPLSIDDNSYDLATKINKKDYMNANSADNYNDYKEYTIDNFVNNNSYKYYAIKFIQNGKLHLTQISYFTTNPISSVTENNTTEIEYVIQSTYDGALIVNANSQGIDYSYEYTITSYFMAIDSISYEFENPYFKYTLNGTYDLDILTNIVINKYSLSSNYTFNSATFQLQHNNNLNINSITINANNKIQVMFNTLPDGEYEFKLLNDHYTTMPPYVLNINSLTITGITNRNSIYEYVLTGANIDTVTQIETYASIDSSSNTYSKDVSTSTFYMSSGSPIIIIESVVIESQNTIVLTFTSSGLQNTDYTFTISNTHASASFTENIIPGITLGSLEKYDGSNLEYKLVGNNHAYVNKVTVNVRNSTAANNFTLSGTTTFNSTDTDRFVDEVIMNTNGDIVVSFNGTELSPGDNTFTVIIYDHFNNGVSQDVTITIEAFSDPSLEVFDTTPDKTTYRIAYSNYTFTQIIATDQATGETYDGSVGDDVLCAGSGSLDGSGGDQGLVFFFGSEHASYPYTRLFNGNSSWPHGASIIYGHSSNRSNVWFKFPSKTIVTKIQLDYISSYQPKYWTFKGYGTTNEELPIDNSTYDDAELIIDNDGNGLSISGSAAHNSRTIDTNNTVAYKYYVISIRIQSYIKEISYYKASSSTLSIVSNIDNILTFDILNTFEGNIALHLDYQGVPNISNYNIIRFPPDNKKYALFCIKGFIASDQPPDHSFYLFDRTSTTSTLAIVLLDYQNNYIGGSGNMKLIKQANSNNRYNISLHVQETTWGEGGEMRINMYFYLHAMSVNKWSTMQSTSSVFEINKSITGVGYSIKVVDHNVYMRLNADDELTPTTDGNEPIDMSFFFIDIEDHSVYPLDDNMHVSSLTSITNTPNTDIPIFSIVEFSINTDSSSVHSISYTFTVLNPDKVASINISVYNSSNDIIYTNTLTSIQSTISVSSNAITISQSGTCRIEASVIAATIELTTVYEETYEFTMPPTLTTPPPNTIFYILVAVPNNGGYEIKFITKEYLNYSSYTYNKPTLNHSDILNAFNQFPIRPLLESFKIEENGAYFTILPQSTYYALMYLGNTNGVLSQGRHDGRVNDLRNDPDYKWKLEPYDGWFSLQLQSGLYWTTDLISNPYYNIELKNDASVKAHIIFLNTDGSTLYYTS